MLRSLQLVYHRRACTISLTGEWYLTVRATIPNLRGNAGIALVAHTVHRRAIMRHRRVTLLINGAVWIRRIVRHLCTIMRPRRRRLLRTISRTLERMTLHRLHRTALRGDTCHRKLLRRATHMLRNRLHRGRLIIIAPCIPLNRTTRNESSRARDLENVRPVYLITRRVMITILARMINGRFCVSYPPRWSNGVSLNATLDSRLIRIARWHHRRHRIVTIVLYTTILLSRHRLCMSL